MFSLGHSTIVFVLALLLSLGVQALDGPVTNGGSQLHQAPADRHDRLGRFLYLIAALNLVILVGILRVFRQMRTRPVRRGRSSSGSSTVAG